MHCSLTKHVSDFVQLMADEDAKAAGRSSFTAPIKGFRHLRQGCSLTKTQRGLVTLSA
jgi:hypothetical protein